MATDLEQRFVAARRQDWSVVWQSHLLAVPLSALVFVALCQSHPSVPFVFAPHLFYWTIVSGVFAWVWPYSYLGVLGMVLGPVALYRYCSYYRHGGTNALLAAGLRGAWAEESWYRRARASLGFALLPTRRLLRRGASPAKAEKLLMIVDPPLRRPSLARWRVILTLSISFHHLPFLVAAQAAFCVRAPWTLQLPSWAGPCQARLGYPPGAPAFGCSKLHK